MSRERAVDEGIGRGFARLNRAGLEAWDALVAERDALLAERNQLQVNLDALCDATDDLLAERDALLAERNRLRVVLADEACRTALVRSQGPRPEPPPFRPSRGLIGYIEKGQRGLIA